MATRTPPGDDSDRSSGTNERIPFGAWLFRIAHNHVVSFHRRVATRGPVSELSELMQDHQRGPEELTETKITVEEVFAAVRELPEAQREVILLRFASGLSVAETAEALGKHETNIKVLQHKGTATEAAAHGREQQLQSNQSIEFSRLSRE